MRVITCIYLFCNSSEDSINPWVHSNTDPSRKQLQPHENKDRKGLQQKVQVINMVII